MKKLNAMNDNINGIESKSRQKSNLYVGANGKVSVKDVNHSLSSRILIMPGKYFNPSLT